jgi:hypothetical protein
MKILNGTPEQIEADLAAINALAANYWQEQGYTVLDTPDGKALIGRVNGQDAPHNLMTLSWDTPKEAPDGTWWITSLSNDTRFTNGYARLADSGYVLQCDERDYPAEWILTEENTI